MKTNKEKKAIDKEFDTSIEDANNIMRGEFPQKVVDKHEIAKALREENKNSFTDYQRVTK